MQAFEPTEMTLYVNLMENGNFERNIGNTPQSPGSEMPGDYLKSLTSAFHFLVELRSRGELLAEAKQEAIDLYSEWEWVIDANFIRY